jgi:glycosyltransferase involved in cell wall biosynthesis
VHDLAWRAVPDAYPALGRRWHEAALARVVARADAVVVPSAATAEALNRGSRNRGSRNLGSRNLGSRNRGSRNRGSRNRGSLSLGDRVTIIAEGCDHLPAPDAPAASARLAQLGVRGSYLLSVSTLEPRKNLDRLLQAYALARPQFPEPWPLVVVGPAGWGPALAPVGGVVLAGSVPAAVLHALFGGARCVAYVPLVEGFGLPAVEAMRAGAPVVASPMPSIGPAGLVVDPLDVPSIAAGLVEAAADSPSRLALIDAGLRRAAELTWEAAARAHVALWTEVAG